jgi:hypothetical protein
MGSTAAGLLGLSRATAVLLRGGFRRPLGFGLGKGLGPGAAEAAPAGASRFLGSAERCAVGRSDAFDLSLE